MSLVQRQCVEQGGKIYEGSRGRLDQKGGPEPDPEYKTNTYSPYQAEAIEIL